MKTIISAKGAGETCVDSIGPRHQAAAERGCVLDPRAIGPVPPSVVVSPDTPVDFGAGVAPQDHLSTVGRAADPDGGRRSARLVVSRRR